MKINKWVIIGTLFLVGIIVRQTLVLTNARHQIIEQKLRTDSVIKLKDSSTVRLANDVISLKDSLQSARAAAKELGGKLIAATRISLTPRVVHDTVRVPNTITDSTRTISIRDTSEAGVLDAEVIVPPFPQDIGLNYSFYPAPVNAVVSLVSVNDSTAVFVVKYTGGETEINASYSKIPPRQKFLVKYGEVLYSVLGDRALSFRLGTVVNFPILNLIGEAQYSIYDTKAFGSVFVGLRKTF